MFEGLSIWQEERYRQLQGTWPVISFSFARIKEDDYRLVRSRIVEIIRNLYVQASFLRDSEVLTEADRRYFDKILLSEEVGDDVLTSSLHQLSDYMSRFYKKR